MEQLELERYLTKGVQRIVREIAKSCLQNPRAAVFMAQHAIDYKQADDKRKELEEKGEHIPPFLIASITEQCNLHCKGCYARATQGCVDHCNASNQLSDKQWGDIFTQAEELGVSFILLAGGEPFVRKDVLEMAGKHKKLLFPVFTNGTMNGDSYMEVLDKNRNVLPVLSIEGNEEATDLRRGKGVYQILHNTMAKLKEKGILFGASITVTRHNKAEVLSDAFISDLKKAGAKAVVYVEFVPMNEEDRRLAPDDDDREDIKKRISALREIEQDMIFVAFPGDEKTSGGCLAAGRGFFHINAHGGAEPCPFSPYSDTNVLHTSLREALHSPLFRHLQENGNLTQEHIGGCVLFEQRKQVEEILHDNKRKNC